MKLKNVKINWLDVFSNWIFLASITYPIHGISTYPLNILAIPFAIGILIRMNYWENNIILKGLLSFIVHFIPFLIVPVDCSMNTLLLNLLFLSLYIIHMYIKNKSILDVYYSIYNDKNKTMQEYINSRS